MTQIKIVIVDDHPVVRSGLAGMLQGQPDFLVVGQAGNGQEALPLVMSARPDVVLTDLRMPVMDGVTLIQTLKSRQLPVHTLVLTTYDSEADILPAIEAGATGYLLKDAPREELFRAVRAAARGESVLAPAVAARLMGQLRAPAGTQLSSREIEVLELVARGHSNGAIGKALHISTATVKTHLIHIFNKLEVSDRTAAVTVALERGIIRLS
jgi:DNA-binding NarL/FixJ family response regulator